VQVASYTILPAHAHASKRLILTRQVYVQRLYCVLKAVCNEKKLQKSFKRSDTSCHFPCCSTAVLCCAFVFVFGCTPWSSIHLFRQHPILTVCESLRTFSFFANLTSCSCKSATCQSSRAHGDCPCACHAGTHAAFISVPGQVRCRIGHTHPRRQFPFC